MTTSLRIAVGFMLVVAFSGSSAASADGSYTSWLDTDQAHGKHKTVVVSAFYTLQQGTDTSDAFVLAVDATRQQKVDGLVAVRCSDRSGTYTFEGIFTLDTANATILPSGPLGIRHVYPRYCLAYVEVTSRKRGDIQADLGIWAESI